MSRRAQLYGGQGTAKPKMGSNLVCSRDRKKVTRAGVWWEVKEWKMMRTEMWVGSRHGGLCKSGEEDYYSKFNGYPWRPLLLFFKQ